MFRKQVFLFLTCYCSFAMAQTKITITNRSFEDIPRMGGNDRMFRMNGWTDCGTFRFPNETPPDIHPGNFWRNVTPPSEGNTYIGMVVRDNESHEGISQKLSAPLKVGKCYKFTIDLAKSSSYWSKSRVTEKDENYIKPAVLRIWGGSGLCNDAQLLGESAAIDHGDWRSYQFKVTPSSAHKYILIEAYYKTPVFLPYCGHILVDNLSDFEEMDCSKTLPPVVNKNGDIVKADKKLPPHKQNRVENSKDKPKPNNDPPVVNNTPKQKILEELDIKKIKVGSTLEIKNLYFKADTSTIEKTSSEVLEEIYLFLKHNPNVTLEIGGHTNGLPSHDYCDRLSSARARAVRDYLISKGIDESRLTYKGYGKRRRIATDSTVEGRTKNQRVEIKILSVG